MADIVKYVGRNVKIGKNVKIWHFTYIGDNSKIGDNTKIASLVHVDRDVRIGRDCKIEAMAYLPPLTNVGDRVFIGPGVVFTNDAYPMSSRMMGVRVEADAVICARSVLRAGVHVGGGSIVGMGSVVTRDIRPGVVVYGNPAKEVYGTSEYLEKKKAWINSRNTD